MPFLGSTDKINTVLPKAQKLQSSPARRLPCSWSTGCVPGHMRLRVAFDLKTGVAGLSAALETRPKHWHCLQPRCLARLSLDAWHGSLGGWAWTGPLVLLCLPSFVSRCLPASMPGTPFVSLHLSSGCRLPSYAWHGSLGGRVHLSPFLSPFVSFVSLSPRQGWMLGTAGWTGLFVSLCLPSFVSCLARLCRWDGSLCLPSFVCAAFWVDGFSVVSQCLAQLSGWTGSFVSLHLSPVVSQPCGQLHLSSFVSLHLFPVSRHGSLGVWLARLSGWKVNPCVFHVNTLACRR